MSLIRQVFLIFALPCTSFLQSAVLSDEPEFSITAQSVLTQHPQASFYQAEFDLGVLPCGKTGSIKLLLENPFSNAFTFDSISKTCNCVGLESEKGDLTIDANADHQFSLRLTTPPSARSDKSYANITLFSKSDADETSINLKLKYQLSGLLSFNQNLYATEIPIDSEFGQIHVPFLITDPIKFEELTLECSRSLRDLIFQIKKADNGQVYLTSQFPASVVDMGPISGQVRVKDPISGRENGFFVTISRGSDVRISPKTLRFVKHEEDDSKLVARAILSLPEDIPKANDGDEVRSGKRPSSNTTKNMLRSVGLLAGGERANVSVKPLSNRVFRLDVTLERTEDFEIEKGAEWHLRIRDLGNRRIQSDIVINE